MSDDETQEIAIEHVRWARACGQPFAMIIASVGDFAAANFDGAVDAIARAQVRLSNRDVNLEMIEHTV